MAEFKNLPAYYDPFFCPHTIIECKLGINWVPLDCLIDTGFAGFLLLPKTYQKYFDKISGLERSYIVGNGEVIKLSNYKGEIKILNKKLTVDVIFSRIHQPLVGINYLIDKHLDLNFLYKQINLWN